MSDHRPLRAVTDVSGQVIGNTRNSSHWMIDTVGWPIGVSTSKSTQPWSARSRFVDSICSNSDASVLVHDKFFLKCFVNWRMSLHPRPSSDFGTLLQRFAATAHGRFWPFATFRGSAAIGRFGGVATVGRISSSSVIYVLILGTVILYRLASSSGTREVRSWQNGEPPDEGRHCILYSQDRQLVGKWPLVGAVCHRDGPNRASGELDRCAPAIRQREV
jgi:hypothetical protein